MRYTVRLFLLCLFFTVLCGHKAHAVTDRCPRHEIKTSMKSKLHKTRIFRGTARGFTAYTQGHSRGDSQTLGFVEYKGLTTTFDMDFETVPIANGKRCVKMTKVRGYFNMHPKLFMPTDYKKSSCEYKQILQHEKRHLAVLKDFHKNYAKRFEAHLGRVARTVPVSPPVETPEDIAKLKKELHDWFVRQFKEFEYKAWILLLEQQRKIDSPQEYRGVMKRCDSW